MREPRIDEAKLAKMHGVVVAPDGVSLSELPGSTLLLLTSDEYGVERDPIEPMTLDHLDVHEMDLGHNRIINLADLVKWAIRQGY